MQKCVNSVNFHTEKGELVKKCANCTDPSIRLIFVKEIDSYLCSKCYQRCGQRKKVIQHDLPLFAEVKLDSEGNPICHICGYAFKKLMSHSWQAHGLSAAEYKKKFGLFTTKAVCAESTKELLRAAVSKHFTLVVRKNLFADGVRTRYFKGHRGRVEMSEQLRRMLVERNKKHPEIWTKKR